MEKRNKQTNTPASSQGRYKKRSFEKTQTRFSLRIDDDLVEWVELQSASTTKNRYINALIRMDMEWQSLVSTAQENNLHQGEVLSLYRMHNDNFDEQMHKKIKEELAKHQRG